MISRDVSDRLLAVEGGEATVDEIEAAESSAWLMHDDDAVADGDDVAAGVEPELAGEGGIADGGAEGGATTEGGGLLEPEPQPHPEGEAVVEAAGSRERRCWERLWRPLQLKDSHLVYL